MSTREQIPLFDANLDELIDHGIKLLKENELEQGYYGCFSGGKDSIAVKWVTEQSGIDVVWHYNKTTIDPPEVVTFIRQHHPDVIFESPKHGNFFRRMEKKGIPPTRLIRWCCDEYKEKRPPNGETLIVGVRSEESAARASYWSEVMTHHRNKATTIAPILHWSSDEIWELIRRENLPYPALYDEGFHRLGCIGCPLAGKPQMEKEYTRWPRYQKLWLRTFRRIWENRKGTTRKNGLPWVDAYFRDADEWYQWWLECKPMPRPLDEALPLFDNMEGDDDNE